MKSKNSAIPFLFLLALLCAFALYGAFTSFQSDAAATGEYRGGYNSTGVMDLKLGLGSAILRGSFVRVMPDGYVVNCVTPVINILGVAQHSQSIPSASGGNSVLVNVSRDAIWYFPVPMSATPTQTMVGMFCDAAGDVTPEIGSSSLVANNDVLEIVGVKLRVLKTDEAGVYIRLNPAAKQGFL